MIYWEIKKQLYLTTLFAMKEILFASSSAKVTTR